MDSIVEEPKTTKASSSNVPIKSKFANPNVTKHSPPYASRGIPPRLRGDSWKTNNQTSNQEYSQSTAPNTESQWLPKKREQNNKNNSSTNSYSYQSTAKNNTNNNSNNTTRTKAYQPVGSAKAVTNTGRFQVKQTPQNESNLAQSTIQETAVEMGFAPHVVSEWLKLNPNITLSILIENLVAGVAPIEIDKHEKFQIVSNEKKSKFVPKAESKGKIETKPPSNSEELSTTANISNQTSQSFENSHQPLSNQSTTSKVLNPIDNELEKTSSSDQQQQFDQPTVQNQVLQPQQTQKTQSKQNATKKQPPQKQKGPKKNTKEDDKARHFNALQKATHLEQMLEIQNENSDEMEHTDTEATDQQHQQVEQQPMKAESEGTSPVNALEAKERADQQQQPIKTEATKMSHKKEHKKQKQKQKKEKSKPNQTQQQKEQPKSTQNQQQKESTQQKLNENEQPKPTQNQQQKQKPKSTPTQNQQQKEKEQPKPTQTQQQKESAQAQQKEHSKPTQTQQQKEKEQSKPTQKEQQKESTQAQQKEQQPKPTQKEQSKPTQKKPNEDKTNDFPPMQFFFERVCQFLSVQHRQPNSQSI